MPRLASWLSAIWLLMTPALAEPMFLYEADAGGRAIQGSFQALSTAVVAGAQIRIVLSGPDGILAHTCSSVALDTRNESVHCLVAHTLVINEALTFVNPPAFKSMIVTSKGRRQTVRFDAAGKLLEFRGGECDGRAFCDDVVAVKWVKDQ